MGLGYIQLSPVTLILPHMKSWPCGARTRRAAPTCACGRACGRARARVCSRRQLSRESRACQHARVSPRTHARTYTHAQAHTQAHPLTRTATCAGSRASHLHAARERHGGARGDDGGRVRGDGVALREEGDALRLELVLLHVVAQAAVAAVAPRPQAAGLVGGERVVHAARDGADLEGWAGGRACVCACVCVCEVVCASAKAYACTLCLFVAPEGALATRWQARIQTRGDKHRHAHTRIHTQTRTHTHAYAHALTLTLAIGPCTGAGRGCGSKAILMLAALVL